MKRQPAGAHFSLIGGVVACLIVSAVVVDRQVRQIQLDDALIKAVKRLDAPAVERLLDQGANPNSRVGGTDALSAISRVLDRLLHGPNSRPVDQSVSALAYLNRDFLMYDGRNTLAFDAMESSLIRHGADIHVPGILRLPPLANAAWFGLHRTLDLLLSRGADVNAADTLGMTPLMGADGYATARLIAHGADVNARTREDLTALSYARDYDVAATLIEHGANINATDKRGFTLLDRMQAGGAWTHRQSAMLRLLRQHGARTNKKLAARTRQHAVTLRARGVAILLTQTRRTSRRLSTRARNSQEAPYQHDAADSAENAQ